jgi:hypothetical protein
MAAALTTTKSAAMPIHETFRLEGYPQESYKGRSHVILRAFSAAFSPCALYHTLPTQKNNT